MIVLRAIFFHSLTQLLLLLWKDLYDMKGGEKDNSAERRGVWVEYLIQCKNKMCSEPHFQPINKVNW